jgi:uncharacterized membrane protein
MTWAARFRLRQALTSSLWIVPLLGGLAGFVLSWAGRELDQHVGAPTAWEYAPATALSVLNTVIVSSVSLAGFVVTVSVLAVQMSTGTFSARYMRLWYRDRVLKAVLAVLVGTFTFSYTLLRHIGNTAPSLCVTFAGLLLMSALILFLAFLDRFVRRLRPVKVASLVTTAGQVTMRASNARGETRDEDDPEILALLGQEPALTVAATRSGSIQAIDAGGLVGIAERNDCVIVLLYAVGDFVSTGAPLAHVYGTLDHARITERRLAGMFALGIERTIEQDPGFAIRVLVDVAIRALSAAVNDPTTAVQVLDYLEDTLKRIGSIAGLKGRYGYRDGAGRKRLLVPVPRWEDFLSLAITEIRIYGASAIQVMRRLRALLLALETGVLPEYRAAVAAELARLDVTVAERLGATGDRELALGSDRQGIGGPSALR